jgi:hypothetical protein
VSRRPLVATAGWIAVVAGGAMLLGVGLGRASWWPWVQVDGDATFAGALSDQLSDGAALAELVRTARDGDRTGQTRARAATLALALGLTAPDALPQVTSLAEALAADPRVPPDARARLGHLLSIVSRGTATTRDVAGLSAQDAVGLILRDPTCTDEARVEQLATLAAQHPEIAAWALLNAAWVEHGRRGLFLHAEARYREALAASDGDHRVAAAAQAGLDALQALRVWRAAKLAAVTPKGAAPKVVDRGGPLDEGEDAPTP